MIVVHRFSQESPSCGYLPDEQSRMVYEVAVALSPQEYEDRMIAGWRKFGVLLFRPACATCRACRSIRVLAPQFVPDRSQRRALKRNSGMEVVFARPTVDEARIALYNRYHEAQAGRKGWDSERIGAEEYALRFLNSTVPAVEVSVWDGNALCAVAITEVTPNAVSAIYHYHDPLRLDNSLGTFVVLQTIELARRLEKPHAYLGFYVAACGSLSYKARFRPCEILEADGRWRAMDAGAETRTE